MGRNHSTLATRGPATSRSPDQAAGDQSAVISDAYSRKVVGWALERTLAARLPLAALEQAIAERRPPPGLVHHSDRGVQYA